MPILAKMPWAVLAMALSGCGSTSTSAASEPAVEETFTTAIPPSEEPTDAPRSEPFGPSPWVGRLTGSTLRYSNGCTDHREVDLLALAQGGREIPIITGWRRRSAQYGWEPHFLQRRDELPVGARDATCVTVTGTTVTYAYQGYGGVPAYALASTEIRPAPCP